MSDQIDPTQDLKSAESVPIPAQNPSVEVKVKTDLEGEFKQKYFDEQAKNSSF